MTAMMFENNFTLIQSFLDDSTHLLIFTPTIKFVINVDLEDFIIKLNKKIVQSAEKFHLILNFMYALEFKYLHRHFRLFAFRRALQI